MGCNCGGRRTPPPTDATLRSGYSPPRPASNGVYELASFPGCTEPYTGAMRHSDVFVVGFGTDAERIFRRDENRDAVVYAKENRLRLHRIPAVQLCQDAGVAIFTDPLDVALADMLEPSDALTE